MPRRLWLSLLAPPIAWFIALSAGFFMVDWACGAAAGAVTLHLTLGVMLGVSAAAGAGAARAWRRDGGSWPGESAEPHERTRFLVVLATFSGGLFSLLILTQWLATLILDPCEPGPRLPFSPSA